MSGDLNRISGLVGSVLEADSKAIVAMEKLHEFLTTEQGCLRESAAMAGADGLTVHCAQITAEAPTPGHFSLGVLHFLSSHIQQRRYQDPYALIVTVDPALYFRTALQFLIDSPLDLSQRVLSAGKSLPKMYADVSFHVSTCQYNVLLFAYGGAVLRN